MTTTFRIAAAAWLLVTGLLLSAQSRLTCNIGRPTILAFFTPASQSEPKEAGADEALADLQFARTDFSIVLGLVFLLIAGGGSLSLDARRHP